MPLIQWIFQNLQVPGVVPEPVPEPILIGSGGGDDPPSVSVSTIAIELSAKLVTTIELKVVPVITIEITAETR